MNVPHSAVVLPASSTEVLEHGHICTSHSRRASHAHQSHTSPDAGLSFACLTAPALLQVPPLSRPLVRLRARPLQPGRQPRPVVMPCSRGRRGAPGRAALRALTPLPTPPPQTQPPRGLLCPPLHKPHPLARGPLTPPPAPAMPPTQPPASRAHPGGRRRGMRSLTRHSRPEPPAAGPLSRRPLCPYATCSVSPMPARCPWGGQMREMVRRRHRTTAAAPGRPAPVAAALSCRRITQFVSTMNPAL